jgi:hypothetical protein
MSGSKVAKLSIKHTDDGPAVAVALPGGTGLGSILKDESLISAIRDVRQGIGHLGPGLGAGCETCKSGVPLYITQDFSEVVVIEFHD